MTCTLSDAKILAFQPKQETDKATEEILDRLIIKGQVKIDNSMQITELFSGFRKQLLTVKFSPYEDVSGDFSFENVSIDDFTVKNKIEKVGQGKDAERIPVEHVFFTMAVRMDPDGECLKKVYSVFQAPIKLEFE